MHAIYSIIGEYDVYTKKPDPVVPNKAVRLPARVARGVKAARSPDA